jgi:hypothetical protein
VQPVNALEPAMKALSLDQLAAKTAEFRGRLAVGETLVDILPEVLSEIDRHRAAFFLSLCPLKQASWTCYAGVCSGP